MAANTEGGGAGPIPLLNEYKHGLLRRRVLQSLAGGPKIRKAPCYVHSIQICLWFLPLLISVLFIILDALGVWNPYYLALVYGCIMGMVVLSLSLVSVCVRYRLSSSSATTKLGGFGPSSQQLDDEESINFESCFDFETFQFIFSQKKVHSLILHPLISGLLSFASCYVLLPSVMLEVLHIAGVVIVSIIGWLILCGVQYSLNIAAPHEIATYRPTDVLELKFLSRPFYVLAIAAVFIPVRILVSQPTVYLQLLYSFLCLLPLGWLLGVLPPLDALLPWIMEQALTRLVGGSHMATDFRLTVMFILSLIAVAIVASLTNHTLAVLLATTFGFLLSQDIFVNTKALLTLLTVPCRRISSNLKRQIFTKTFISHSTIDFHPVKNYKSYLIHLATSILKGSVLLTISLTVIYFTFTLSNKELVTTIIAGCVVGLFVLLEIGDTLQSVYIFRLFRNPLFPIQCDDVIKFKQKRKLLHYFSLPQRVLITYLSPLLLLTYVGLGLETPSTTIPNIWYGIAAARILRKVWQSTSSAHLELVLVAILHFALLNSSSNSWSNLGLGIQALVIGLALDIAQDALKKLSFMGTMFVTFLYDRKQRTYLLLTIAIIVGTIVFFPLILVVVLLSSVLSAPLLPLFTLPVFIVSFPRTRRFWPSLMDYGSTYSKCNDSIYYQQAESEIVRILHSGGPARSNPGTFLLLRFEDRLVVAMILESGYGYCVMNIRGLELQETSCHSIEATRIDDIFESVYGSSGRSCHDVWFNKHILNTLQPVDSAVIETYSDARNVLTGIIDQPSGLERFSSNLIKALVWVFYHHFKDTCCNPGKRDITSPRSNPGTTTTIHQHIHTDSGFAGSRSVSGQDAQKSTHNEFITAWEETTPSIPPQQGAELRSIPLNRGEEDAISWSDSISSIDEGTLSPAYPALSAGAPGLSLPTAITVPSPPGLIPQDVPGLIPEDRPLDIHRVYSETTTTTAEVYDIIQSDVRLSAIPLSGVNTGCNSRAQKNCRKSSKVFPGASPVNGCKDLSRWMEYPHSYTQIEKLMKELLPTEWLGFIKDKCEDSSKLDTDLESQLKKVVVACFSLVDVPCGAKHQGRSEPTTPYDIYKGYCGDFPFSVNLEWLTGDQVLYGLVLKAYRYAVRLMYDEGSLGEVEDHQELYEYFDSYDREHYIGRESEPGWSSGILSQIPHLFSLGRDLEKNVYTAHVLTLQDQVVHIGSLNPAAVHGIWVDLTFELFYLTNDDEERYSIQAHPNLLRNLTIQTADPPLGYSVYSSGLVRAPHT